MAFRNGQWVKFSVPTDAVPGQAKDHLDKIHQAADGLAVGLYVKGGTDSYGEKVDERVVPVDGVGGNIQWLEGSQVCKLSFAPGDLGDLQPVLERSDVPAERLKNNPDWQPKP